MNSTYPPATTGDKVLATIMVIITGVFLYIIHRADRRYEQRMR